MTGVFAIIVIMVAVVGSALSADIVFTPPNRVISGDSKRQDSLTNQQAELAEAAGHPTASRACEAASRA